MIWKRYFVRELLPTFFLIIFSAYFLFILIDYSTHAKTFHQPGLTFIDTLQYYLYQFTQHAQILVTVALMLSTIKVLTTLNTRREIVALAAAGLSLKRLTSPFLTAAFICMVFLYANFQWIEPRATVKLEAFEAEYFKGGEKAKTHETHLKDGSLLLYHHYDLKTHALYDLFWIKELNTIYHIKQLDLSSSLGHYVDLIERKGDFMSVEESFPSLLFPQMEIDTTTFLPKSLLQKMREPKWDTALFYKLTIPFATLFAVVATFPFCLKFTRHLPTYFIYTFSLFGLISYFTIVQASVILGQSQVLAPLLAIMAPPIFVGTLIFWSYAKL
ncbi:MAG: hypothetical protein S4CHLAM45_08370 [Chlamydiales bacterium]|nr:hypothetical protein [Chlamydiales bacterium]MCH9620413.1 hypothetical protein [Chlamydiales bacterium]MCH9622941.1 hypothetical protein [Chlamydiales bacterium]